ncbi:MAG: HEAT repeat domain-containing protein, partial [Acidobacteriota bacterium]
LLHKGNERQKELAAIALGSLGDPEAIPSLFRVYRSLKNRRGQGNEALRVALILALGEIGHEEAVEALADLYQSKDSVFQAQRKQLVLSSLGLLAQQGSVKAEQHLTRLLNEKDEGTQVEALCELAVAYWHRPDQIPDSLLLRMSRLARQGRGQIRQAALSSLRSLADLGCRPAEEFFEGEGKESGIRNQEEWGRDEATGDRQEEGIRRQESGRKNVLSTANCLQPTTISSIFKKMFTKWTFPLLPVS